MQRWIIALCALVIFAAGIDFSLAQGFGLAWTGSGAASSSIPTLIGGAAVPQSEDNANPSMSRWSPSCLSSAWGGGCNVSTQTCTAPSGGTPLETCQPPLQLYVTGGSGNGITATINYHSESGYVFPTGTPLMISGALQTAWNTPIGKITNLTFTHNGTKCISATDWCASVDYASTPFISGTPVYVGGLTGTLGSMQNQQNGFGANITAGSCCTGGVLSVTIDNPIFGTTPTTGDYIIGSLTFSSGSCPGTPLLCVLDTRLTLQSSSAGGTVLNFTAPAGSPTVTISGGYMSYETGSQGPNGKWTADATSSTEISYDISATFPNGIDGAFGALNQQGYNGTVTQPWPVTSSVCNIGGNPKSCSVSFANPTSCASNCVTVETAQSLSGTKIVAGQFSEPVMAWDSGPSVPLAIEGDVNNPNTEVEKCVATDHVSGIRGVYFALDGGSPVEATKPILDPWGVGAAYNTNDPYNSGVVNNTYVYCAQFPASSVADGEHEIRAWAVANAGPIGQLTSAITADVTNGSATINSLAHHLAHNYVAAVTQSVDPNYPVYNGATYGTTFTLASPYAVYASGSPPTVTYTYTLGSNLARPIDAGSLVTITGVTNNNSCPITGGSSTGAAITYTFSGSCSFPVGSTVNIAGLSTPTAQSVSISNIAYTSATGDLAVTISSALWGTNPGYQYITQFTIEGVTGSSCTSPNGARPIQSSGGSGTILHFNIGAGLASVCSTLTGATVQSNTYTWNGNNVPVTATSSGQITVAGLSTAAYPGGSGTITENWNRNCAVSAAQTATSPYSITCPIDPNSATATVTSAATNSIQVNSNLLCINGGPGDEPAPYDPAFEPSSVMTNNHFEALPALPNSCSTPNVITNVGEGCHAEPCGIPGSINSTIWLYRKDAGTYELADVSRPIARGNDGSFFVLTNATGTMKERNAYVDGWNPSSVTSGCSSGPSSALAWNATRSTYGGSYCANASYARSDLVYGNSYSTFQTATVSGDAPSCLVLTNASQFNNFYAGEAVAFSGMDAGPAGDGSNGALNAGQYYWVFANLGGGAIELSRTGNLASCITVPSHTTITSAKLSPDFSNDNVFFKCNTSLGCSTSNPEPAISNPQPFSSTTYAKAGWFSFLPDLANGTTQHEVDLIKGCTTNCTQFATTQGRIRSSLDRTPQNMVVTPSNSVGPTLPTETSSGGSLVGTCNGADPACQETLTWSAETNCQDSYAPCTTNSFTGATFQNPNNSAGHDMPGQNIVISGSGNSAWNCGTGAAPCVVLSSTNTSVTFLNSAATGAYSGASTITPLSLAIELPTGTFPNNAGSPNCGNASFQAIIPSVGNTMCLASSGVSAWNGIAAKLWPVEEGTQEWVDNSNCVVTNNGGFSASYPVYIQSVIVNSGDADVITIGTTSTAQPVTAINACPTFEFSYGFFAGSATSESWDSGATVNGPNYWEQTDSPYILASFTEAGLRYITNGSRYNSNSPSDYASYTWGFSSIYNVGNCHNDSGTGYHIRCIAFATAAPDSVGGGGTNNPPSIIHTWSSYANYVANSPILCGGVDCVTSASKIFQLSDNGDGTVPPWITFNIQARAFCNYNTTTPLLTIINNLSVTWWDRTNNVFEISGTAGSCNPITSAIAFFQPSFHPDTVFWATGPWYTSLNEFLTRGQWIVAGNTFISQFDSTGSGETEGLFSEGGSFQNMAFENGTMQNVRVPESPPTNASAGVYLGSYGNVNWLVKNNNLYAVTGTNTAYNANGFPSWFQQAPLGDLFWINDNLGTAPLYPYQPGWTPTEHGQFSLTQQYWNDTSEIPGFGPTTFTQFNTGGWFPSQAWGVNASGVPTYAGQPSLYSLNLSPWYTSVTGDSGKGLY